MSTRDKLIDAIEDYLRRSGMSARSFGKSCLNDPNLVYHLRANQRDVTSTTIDRIEDWMRKNPPAKKKRRADESRTAA